MKASSAEPAAAIRVRIAAGMVARARGLLWHAAPAPGGGLLLAGVRTVHGFGLSRPLDLVYLDGEGQVLSCAELAPWRIARCSAACHVVELRQGECARLQLMPGQPLQVTIVEDIFDRAHARGRQGLALSPAARRPLTAAAVIALALAALSCLVSAAASGAENAAGVAAAAGSEAPAAAEAPAVDRYVGEPRRKRLSKARASLHREAADGKPAKPLPKARPRRPKDRPAPVEYLVGEPGRHGARPNEHAPQGTREHEPGRRR